MADSKMKLIKSAQWNEKYRYRYPLHALYISIYRYRYPKPVNY